jgi:hypothetical protein
MIKLFEKTKPQNIFDSIDPKAVNLTDSTYINIICNEFIRIKGSMVIPKIPAKELSVADSGEIIASLASFIPEFLRGHSVPYRRIPPAEQHFLHFTRLFHGRLLDFRHIFKADLKFAGNPDGIIEKGTSDFYPSFRTDRIYYKSRLIPEMPQTKTFSPVRIMDTGAVMSDDFFFTSTIFEDINKDKLTLEICGKLPEIFTISPKLYPFVVYDYFTACLNVLNPTEEKLDEAVSIFEPLFLFIYSRFKDINLLADIDKIREYFADFFEPNMDELQLTQSFVQKLKDYFSRFNLIQNEEMALLGWRQFAGDL